MFPTYQNILIATDLTENSEHAFKHAVLLARLHDARIHLLHVVPQIEPVYLSSLLGQEKELNKLKLQREQEALEEVRKQLDMFAATELADHPEDMKRFAGAMTAFGDPVDEILATGRRINADVIVIGTHSKGVIEHAFLGSVAEKVLKHADRPIFVIPRTG